MRVLNALEGCWILLIFSLAFFWYPAHLFSQPRNYDLFLRIASNWVRMVLVITVVICVLSWLAALNAVNLLMLFVLPITVGRFLRKAKTTIGWRNSLQSIAVRLVRQLETWYLGLQLVPRPRLHLDLQTHRGSSEKQELWLKNVEGKELLLGCLTVVLITTCVLAANHAIEELRLDQPDQYIALLHARQLTVGLRASMRPVTFPAMIVTTSLLSGRDPMQVARFLSPAVSVLVVLATGLLVRVCTHEDTASVAAMYCLGAAAFPPAIREVITSRSIENRLWTILRTSPAEIRATSEFGLGLIFVLLALAFIVDWYKSSKGWDSLLDFGSCLVLSAVISRSLILILAIGAAALLLQSFVGLMIFVPACYGLAAYAMWSPSTIDPTDTLRILPVAAAIGVGFLLAWIQTSLMERMGRTGQTALLVGCVAAAFIWFRPHQLPTQCVEYEAAARATERIEHEFPRQTWAVAAPVEQLSETLGLGAHEDLARFVETYQHDVGDADFRFPDARDDLFIYVEKRPFQIFTREPEAIPFPVLADTTYRNYRSPGGRASLESAALKLCEDYRQHHPNTNVFFENEDLRIYHVHQQHSPDNRRARE